MTKKKSTIEEQMLKSMNDTFDNMFPKKETVKENVSGVPLQATSAIKSEDRAELLHLYDRLKKEIDPTKFNVDFQQDRIYITNTTDSQLGYNYSPYQKTMAEELYTEPSFNYTPYLVSLLEYMISNGMNVEPIPDVILRSDPQQSNEFFCRTAYYEPETKKIVLYTYNRLPKDVVRSFAHEMIHHIQNMEGRLNGIGATTNTNEDSNLDEIEKEAYLLGNITFRNWEDSQLNNDQR